MGMSDALQILFDSGALYIALGAVICIALEIGDKHLHTADQ